MSDYFNKYQCKGLVINSDSVFEYMNSDYGEESAIMDPTETRIETTKRKAEDLYQYQIDAIVGAQVGNDKSA